MDNNKIGNIKRIVLWITEVESINRFCEQIRFSRAGDENKVIKTTYIFDHKVNTRNVFGNGVIEIDNNMMADFCEFLREREKHLQKIIGESDKDLVDIAKEYLKGDFGELLEK